MTKMTVSEISISIPTADDMRTCGELFASLLQSGDVILLSGPLGAGKTTFAQGVGTGLHLNGLIVSPTFTIARELYGTFASGQPAHLVHVDAYRIGGVERAAGSDMESALFDELESLGLDEELEDPSEGTIILMEWGEQMANILSQDRLEISINRTLTHDTDTILTADGTRTITFHAIGNQWDTRFTDFQKRLTQAHLSYRA
ncbi:MAG: tRNA (adenosine(37)-N6)-threonylcarbamoyltransferase complex ATPase subunit type 1 TsaE [Aeriscardovia sp.]|nr:tRNA (adenosine(37)-N6)-threonylcarbamoyltransferase complex ATPase subunit type 1 TsaE [Aeriscardovia sp.]MBR3359280.1 tRNA (adenosine(37)-N6)-threonylcarbamoyltransferase complex ATPase subunit type 1 TsaE [Aeriscardovia sp.]